MAETRRETIRRIYKASGADALWRWARRAQLRGRFRRWRALRRWAANQRAKAHDAGKDKAARRWDARVDIYREKERQTKRRWLESQEPDAPPTTQGIVTFDGKPCAAWLARHLQTVRDAGRWTGYLVSGYRTPEYSRQLCRNMCGADSCPGRCAGVTSNHTRYVEPEGAVDVSDYTTFGAECRRLDIPIWNALGAQDPVHFSTSGR